MTLTRTLLHLPERNLHMSALVAGDAGPLVVLCHGFPGLSYSYRHQLTALAAAGYRAVALDMKGYGQSDRPLALEAYQARVVSDDLAAVLDALGAERAVFVGHDFGAKAAFCMALHHPERVAGVVSLAVPYGVQFAGAKDEPAGGKAAAEGSAPAGARLLRTARPPQMARSAASVRAKATRPSPSATSSTCTTSRRWAPPRPSWARVHASS
jgi:pimeloyl-ACP methyl ester carboxylesterase